MASRFKRLYEWLVFQHPVQILLFIALLLAVALYAIPNAKLDASADALTLENDNSINYYRDIITRYKTGDTLFVTFSPKKGDLFDDANLKILLDLKSELQQLDTVSKAYSILDLPLMNSPRVTMTEARTNPRTLLTEGVDRQLAKKEFWESPIYRNTALSDDGQTTIIRLDLKLDEEFYSLVKARDQLRLKRDSEGLSKDEVRSLQKASEDFLDYRTLKQEKSTQNIANIREIMDRYRGGAELHLGGISMITSDMVDFVRSDLKFFGTGVVLFIILMLSIIFRELRWVILPLISCCLSVALVLGYLAWIDWRLTVISSNFVALLLIITLSMTVHLVVRYRELLFERPDADKNEMVREMVSFMWKPCLYTILTTMVAFTSLVVSGIRPVIDFGWMMTIGLMVAFIVVFIVLPASMILMGRANASSGNDSSRKLTFRFAYLTEHHGNLILLLYFLVALSSAYGISQLKVENRYIDYFYE